MKAPGDSIRDNMVQPVADALMRATGRDCFAQARWALCAGMVAFSAFAVSRLVTRPDMPAGMVATYCTVTICAVAAAAALSAALSRIEESFPTGATDVDDHPLHGQATAAVLVVTTCLTPVILSVVRFLPQAPVAERSFDLVMAAGAFLVGSAVLLTTCTWRKPPALPVRHHRHTPGTKGE